MLALIVTQLTMIVQVPCTEREGLTHLLDNVYHEEQIALGEVPSGEIVEVWYNIETGTMTVLRTYADGMACIQAVAQDMWFNLEQW